MLAQSVGAVMRALDSQQCDLGSICWFSTLLGRGVSPGTPVSPLFKNKCFDFYV